MVQIDKSRNRYSAYDATESSWRLSEPNGTPDPLKNPPSIRPEAGQATFLEADGRLVCLNKHDEDKFLFYSRRGLHINYEHIMVPAGTAEGAGLSPLQVDFQDPFREKMPAPLPERLGAFLGHIPSSLWLLLIGFLRHILAMFWDALTQLPEDEDSPKPPQADSVIDMQWHPALHRFALLHKKCLVFVFDASSNVFLEGNLWCEEQKNASQLSWRPPGGSELAVSCLNCVVLWSVTYRSAVAMGEERTFLTGVPKVIPNPSLQMSLTTHMSWSPDGEMLAFSRVGGGFVIRNISSGSYEESNQEADMLTFSPDGRYLAAGWRRRLSIRDTETWEERTYDRLHGNLLHVSWISKGTLIFAFQKGDQPVFACWHIDSRQDAPYPVRQQSAPTEMGMLGPESSMKLGGLRLSAVATTHNRLAAIFRLPPEDCQAGPGTVCTLWRLHSKQNRLVMAHMGVISGAAHEARRIRRQKEEHLTRRPSPCLARFAKSLGQGDLMSLVWSNGKIQFIPLFHAENQG